MFGVTKMRALLIAILLLLPLNAFGAQIIWESPSLSRHDDMTMIREGSSSNFGDWQTITFKTDTSIEYLVLKPAWSLELSDLMGVNTDAVLDSAKVFIYVTGAPGGGYAYKGGSISADWVQTSTSYAVLSPSITWGDTTTTGLASGAGYVGVDITKAVQRQIDGEANYGYAIGFVATTGAVQQSAYSNYRTTYNVRPYIKVWISYTEKRPFWHSQHANAYITARHIRSDDGNLNSSTALVSEFSGGYWNALIKFANADSMSGLTVNAAHLMLSVDNDNYTGTPASETAVHHLSYDWTTGATWNHANGSTGGWNGAGDNFGTSAPFGSAVDTYYNSGAAANSYEQCWILNLTASEVQNWVDGTNYGVLLRRTDAMAATQADVSGWTGVQYIHEDISVGAGFSPQAIIVFEYAAPSTGFKYGSVGPTGTWMMGQKKGVKVGG